MVRKLNPMSGLLIPSVMFTNRMPRMLAKVKSGSFVLTEPYCP